MKNTNNNMKTLFKRTKWLCALLVAWTVFSLLLSPGYAVTNTDFADWKLEATSNQGTVDSIEKLSDGRTGWKITASGYTTDGSCGGAGDPKAADVSITLTNRNDTKVTFTLNVTKTTNGSAESTSQTLEGAKELSITGAQTGTGKGVSNVITIVIENANWESAGVEVDTTFNPSVGGTYAVDGTKVSNSTTITNLDSKVYNLVATPADGYTLFGWMSSNGILDETGATSYSHTGKVATTIWPLFIKTGSAVYYVKDAPTKVYYGFFDDAISAAGTSGTVILYQTGIMYGSAVTESETASYTLAIPQNITFLVPYNSSDDGSTEPKNEAGKTVKMGAAYKTVTIPSNITLQVSGTLLVNAVQGRCDDGAMQSGGIQGTYGCVCLKGHITVESGGALKARGLILPDESEGAVDTGRITAKSGSSVYQFIEIVDWRGGTASSAIAPMVGSPRHFVFSTYSMQNIQVETVYQYGSTLSGSYYITCSALNSTQVFCKNISVVGSSGALFSLTDGSIVFRYSRQSTREDGTSIFAKTTIDLYGTMQMNNLSVSISAIGVTYTVNTEDSQLPLSATFDINVMPGGKLISAKHIKLLPGVRVTVEHGGELVVQNGLYLYDVDDFDAGYCYASYYRLPTTARMGNKVIAKEYWTDAELIIKGKLTVDGGYVYSSIGTDSSSSVDLTSTQILTGGVTTGVLEFKQVPSQKASLKESTQSGSDTTAVTIYFSGAIGKIKSTYSAETNVAVFTANTYYSDGTAWYIPTLGVHPTDTLESDGMTVDGKYRLEDYLWMNALCYFDKSVDWTKGTVTVITYNADGTPCLNANNVHCVNTFNKDGASYGEGVQVVAIGTEIYLVKKIPADEIPDTIIFILDYTDGTTSYTSAPIYVSIDDCKNGTNDTLVEALKEYGTAADIYFNHDGSLTQEQIEALPATSPTGSSVTVVPQAKPESDVKGVSLETTSAIIYFDEALRLGIRYALSGDLGDYSIAQVGLLVGDSTWEGTLITDGQNFTKAYLLYNAIQGNQPSPGELNNKPFDKDDEKIELVDDAFSNPSLDSLANGELVFDLGSLQYMQTLSLRPVFVLTDGTNYYCVYGRQIGYGLEAYINGVYSDSSNEYKHLLVKTWAVAQATKAAFGG